MITTGESRHPNKRKNSIKETVPQAHTHEWGVMTFKCITGLLLPGKRSEMGLAKYPMKTEPQREKEEGKIQGGLTWESLGNPEPDKKSTKELVFLHR